MTMSVFDCHNAPITSKQIEQWTNVDPTLSMVKQCVISVIWSNVPNESHDKLRPYLARKNELSCCESGSHEHSTFRSLSLSYFDKCVFLLRAPYLCLMGITYIRCEVILIVRVFFYIFTPRITTTITPSSLSHDNTLLVALFARSPASARVGRA